MSVDRIALLVVLVTAGVFALLGFLYASRRTIDLEDYVASRGQFGSWITMATVASAGLGAWILFSPPQVGATSGVVGILGYALAQAAPSLNFAGIGPRIRHLMPQGHSLNEYILYRFGQGMYALVLVVVLSYMSVYLVAELTAIAKAVELLAHVPLGWTALVVMTATFLYTSYGGLGTTIVTDAMQFALIVPLLLIVFGAAVATLGGWEAAIKPLQSQAPELFSWSNVEAIKFALSLLVAVVVAELFNQTNWQRVYACRDNRAVRRGFVGASLVTVPMMVLAGGLGLLGRSQGYSDDRTAFLLISHLGWPLIGLVVVLILGLALVMSTIAALLNGISIVLTLDVHRLFPAWQPGSLLKMARLITVGLGLLAVTVASQGYDVLYLFLLADLVCAGVYVPVLGSFYLKRLTGSTALISALLGIGSGALFFPRPDFTAWLDIPFGGDLLVSFMAPLVVSTLGVVIGVARSSASFEFDHLQDQILPLQPIPETSISDAHPHP